MDSDYPAPSRVEPIAVERKAVVWIAGGVAASLITIVVMLIALPKGDPPPDIKPPPVVVAPDNPTPPVTPPAPTPTPVEIKPNSAMYFDGDDDYVVIPSLVFDGKPPLTIEAIVSVHDAKRDAAIVALGGTGFAKLKHNERGFRGYGSTSLAGKGRAYHVAAHGGAVHVAFVWTGDDARMYVDGRDVQPYANEITFKSRGATNARIGVHKFEDHIEYFKGVIDEVRISNTARYDTDSPAPTVRVGHRFETDEHTVALYHFDGEDAEKLIDSSGNDHHGTIVGAKRIDFIGKSSPDSVSD